MGIMNKVYKKTINNHHLPFHPNISLQENSPNKPTFPFPYTQYPRLMSFPTSNHSSQFQINDGDVSLLIAGIDELVGGGKGEVVDGRLVVSEDVEWGWRGRHRGKRSTG